MYQDINFDYKIKEINIEKYDAYKRWETNNAFTIKKFIDCCISIFPVFFLYFNICTTLLYGLFKLFEFFINYLDK